MNDPVPHIHLLLVIPLAILLEILRYLVTKNTDQMKVNMMIIIGTPTKINPMVQNTNIKDLSPFIKRISDHFLMTDI